MRGTCGFGGPAIGGSVATACEAPARSIETTMATIHGNVMPLLDCRWPRPQGLLADQWDEWGRLNSCRGNQSSASGRSSCNCWASPGSALCAEASQ